jgi:hypothetical protein
MKLTVFFLAIAGVALAANDLETFNVDQTMTFDQIGDGVLTLKLTLNGEQFQNWQSKYGTNQSLLKRDMSAYVSQYEASGWDMQVNQMDRIVTITCKFKGAVLYRGAGLFEFRVPKAWRGGERNGSIYSFNYVELIRNGLVAQNNVRLVLPAESSNFADDKAETGDRVIRYHLPVSAAAGWLLWAGIAALLVGAAATAFALLGMKAGGGPVVAGASA